MPALASRAEVPTDAAARYAKQLVSHLGRKIVFAEEQDGSWTAAVGDGRARITAGPTAIVLAAEAPDVESLTRVEHVLGGHLERFGSRAELAVTWHRAV